MICLFIISEDVFTWNFKAWLLCDFEVNPDKILYFKQCATLYYLRGKVKTMDKAFSIEDALVYLDKVNEFTCKNSRRNVIYPRLHTNRSNARMLTNRLYMENFLAWWRTTRSKCKHSWNSMLPRKDLYLSVFFSLQNQNGPSHPESLGAVRRKRAPHCRVYELPSMRDW